MGPAFQQRSRPRHRRPLSAFTLALGALIALTAAVLPIAGATTDVVDAAIDPAASRYVPVTPIRVLDTSSDPGRATLGPNGTVTIDPVTEAVASAAGVTAADVTAVAINLTVFNTVAPGFTSVFPAGGDEPLVSSINNDRAGQFIPNLAIVKRGAGGAITILSLAGSDVIVDVQGVLVTSDASSDGRFVALAPRRQLDTRDANLPIAAGQTRTVDLRSAGVPDDARAAVLNVTVTETAGPGFVTVWKRGDAQPSPASNVNYPTANYTVANSVITGVDAGRIDVFSLVRTHLIVDVLGYITGPSAEVTTDGLYVPLDPRRIYDTRPGEVPVGSSSIGAEQAIRIAVSGVGDIPQSGVAAIAMNLGATGSAEPGFLAAYASGTVRPNPYSTVNVTFPFQTVANHAIAQLSSLGGIDVYSLRRTDAFVDVTGYFLGDPVMPASGLVLEPAVDVKPPTPPIPAPDDDFDYLTPFELGGIRRGGERFLGWNPCESITYAINADQATQPMVDSLHEAIVEIEIATGFDMVYAGRVTGSLHVPVDPSQPADISNDIGAQAVFGFSTVADTPALRSGTIGIGGQSADLTFSVGQDPVYYTGDGMAIVDIDDVSPGSEMRVVFMHEIGHMIGLAHVPAGSGELMEARLTSQRSFGDGDLNGLRNAGSANCGTDGARRNALDAPTDDDGERPTGRIPARWEADMQRGCELFVLPDPCRTWRVSSPHDRHAASRPPSWLGAWHSGAAD